MKKRFFSLMSLLLVLVVLATPASAGPGIKLSGVQFSLSSLVAKGYASGLGNADVSVVIDASGPAATTCINYGGNQVPGQSYPKLSATGNQFLAGDSLVRKNGRSPFDVETVDPETVPWYQAGCPNANWVGYVNFIFWENATISVYDANTQALLLKQDYTCKTTLTSVSCMPK